MTTVRIADLKARLSAHLRAVRDGETIEVLDRDTPVARIVPLDADAGALAVRRPRTGAAKLADVPIPPAVRLRSDPVELLLEDREGGR